MTLTVDKIRALRDSLQKSAERYEGKMASFIAAVQPEIQDLDATCRFEQTLFGWTFVCYFSVGDQGYATRIRVSGLDSDLDENLAVEMVTELRALILEARTSR